MCIRDRSKMAKVEILCNLPQAVPNKILFSGYEQIFVFESIAQYSNYDFLMLGQLLEMKTNKAFPFLMALRVYQNPKTVFPLFMTKANFYQLLAFCKISLINLIIF
eukprot:TRINITY_DN1962_c0_g1_i6.p2 TRINITY_DN1962_c0_g1~~TRINITY_DN1962_c0_g1_i6.p2  ORF type:complete len:121 (-),score=27.75 TRINITY_DN1962_c0_g1_i6:122-439(-)